jgi:hypothetical protein
MKQESNITVPMQNFTGLNVYRPQTDCDQCSKPCPYPNRDYYPVSVICYCRPQLVFLIENMDLLQDGQYPLAHIESGYTDIDPSIRVQQGSEAGFINPALIYSDVSSRLERCRDDGHTLVHEITVLHVDYYEMLSPAARNALNYCAGWRRKRQKYHTWIRDQRRKRKIHKSVVL